LILSNNGPLTNGGSQKFNAIYLTTSFWTVYARRL